MTRLHLLLADFDDRLDRYLRSGDSEDEADAAEKLRQAFDLSPRTPALAERVRRLAALLPPCSPLHATLGALGEDLPN